MQRNDDGFGRQIDRYPNIHPMRQGALPGMPWHSDDKPFGVSQEQWDLFKMMAEAHALEDEIRLHTDNYSGDLHSDNYPGADNG